MKYLSKSLIILPAVALLAACTKLPTPDPGPGTNPTDPTQPEVAFRQAPDKATVGATVEIVAIATVGEGKISRVTLHCNDGTAKSIAMEPAGTDKYSVSITAPAEAGKTVEYYVEAVTDAGKSACSETITLTATAEPIIPENKAKYLRLSEIGTYDQWKFIELYNPTGEFVNLDGVELWKNGELLTAFDASHELNARNYAVYRAKGCVFQIPAGAIDLGTTDTGLSGSKSLSVELRFEGEIIDAFANTINPGVWQMAPDEWDEEPEQTALNFIRRRGEATGWYAVNGDATPGAANTSATVKLKHQLFAADAVADIPYFTGISINPDASTPSGLTPSANTIEVRVYTDAHNPSLVVTATLGGASVEVVQVEGPLYRMTPANLNGGTASGTPITLRITASNATGTYPKSGDNRNVELLVFPAGQQFGSYSDISLNEIVASGGDGIELYNRSRNPVVIAGMRIRKNKDRVFTVPGYMVMKGEGFAVLGFKDTNYTPTSGTDYLYLGSIPNGLSGSKSLLIELRKPKVDDDLTNSTNIDSFVNTSDANPTKDSAWDSEGAVEKSITSGAGRKTDGTGEWYLFTTPNLGKSNSGAFTSGSAFTGKYTQSGVD